MVNCSYIQCFQIKYFNVFYNYNNIMIRHKTLSKNGNEVFSSSSHDWRALASMMLIQN